MRTPFIIKTHWDNKNIKTQIEYIDFTKEKKLNEITYYESGELHTHTAYRENQTKDWKHEYDKNKKILRSLYYKKDKNTLSYQRFYHDNEKIRSKVYYFDNEVTPRKEYNYQEDGCSLINDIDYYNYIGSGFIKKIVSYKEDGKTIFLNREYSYYDSGYVKDITDFRADGTKKGFATKYENGNIKLHIYYQENGKSMLSEYHYNNDGKLMSETYYRNDGITICAHNDYSTDKSKLLNSGK